MWNPRRQGGLEPAAPAFVEFAAPRASTECIVEMEEPGSAKMRIAPKGLMTPAVVKLRIPSVTHGDGTGRFQAVERAVNPPCWRLVRKFEDLTGLPMLLTTSSNGNESIVNTSQGRFP